MRSFHQDWPGRKSAPCLVSWSTPMGNPKTKPTFPVEKSQPLGTSWENFLQLDEISLEYVQPLGSKEWHNQEEFVENFIELHSWGSGNYNIL